MRYASARLVLQAAILVSLFTSIAQSQTTTAAPAPQGSLTTTQVNWPQFHFTFNGTRRNPYETVLNAQTVPGLKVKWTYTMGAYSVSSPAIVNGVVYVGSNDGYVHAFNASTGAKLWKYKTGSYINYSSPAVANGIVYIGSWDDNVYALNASTGAKIWSFKTGNYIDSSPAVVNGIVYIGSADSNLYALNAKTGAKIWSFSGSPGPVNSSPTVVNGVVYSTSGYNLYALNATTGAKLWSFTAGGVVDDSPLRQALEPNCGVFRQMDISIRLQQWLRALCTSGPTHLTLRSLEPCGR